ncbi:hypothetical protein [Gluconobacter kanchanaburiensis]|uniref:Uncharacterized protein n=1 Tax=Gluconobacter kanchanaburiensis NBRC 103587 TaxID=1307948 RepID=A0A511BAD6_9PROT|nr:hypothetical protein [Gluconobacter kanchanaburiensis]MBF0862997.1 hypothetical protein [Gluconobacter kanchanaburiensis]GEK97380.1 hypothetical protein GKA01_25770 [Gluconobacter kanchanaburiensis NBRC 103587]
MRLAFFFVLAHLVTGLRNVFLAHGVGYINAGRIWGIGLVLSVLIAALILNGMGGVRSRGEY